MKIQFLVLPGISLLLMVLSFFHVSLSIGFFLTGFFCLCIFCFFAYKLNEIHTMLVENVSRLTQKLVDLQNDITYQAARLEVIEELSLPKNVDSYLQAADKLKAGGQLRLALNICLKGLEFFPQEKPLITLISSVFEEMGNYAEAAQYLKKIETISPNDSMLRFQIADLFFQAKNYPEAVNYYDKALNLGFDTEDIYLNKGEALVKTGKLAEAMAWYGKGIQKHPNSLELRSNRAKLYMELGEHTACLKEANHILEINPEFAAARYNKACCLNKLGDLTYAKQELVVALQSDPSLLEKAKQDPDLQNIQGEIYQVEAVVETGEKNIPLKVDAKIYES